MVGGVISFQIYKESPAWGAGSPSNPPCDPSGSSPDGSGSQVYPSTSGTWHEITLDEAVCFNHGLDPRNLDNGSLRHASFVSVPLTAPLLQGDAVSFIAKTSWTLSSASEVSVEIYYVGDD